MTVSPQDNLVFHYIRVGLVIIGGLTTSTFLTLMIIPTIYSIIDDMTGFFKRVAGAA